MAARTPISPFAAELCGTALLLAVGLSFVILDFGSGSPMLRLVPDPGLRRLLTGFLFGTTGALIAVSPLGKASGAHINPVVTLAFWVKGRIRAEHALGYVVAQLAGGALGCLPLLAWGAVGGSIDYGATTPGPGYGLWAALGGEIATTFAMVLLVFVFVTRPRIRNFTPLLFPPLYAVMVFFEATISGTSTNPARSLGPSLISGSWEGWWIYWVGPLAGALLAVAVHGWLARLDVEVAKLFHFDHDPHGVFAYRRERKRSA